MLKTVLYILILIFLLCNKKKYFIYEVCHALSLNDFWVTDEIENAALPSLPEETTLMKIRRRCECVEKNRKRFGPYIKLIMCSVSAALITVLHGGWNGMQNLLYKAGAFENACNTSDVSSFTFGNHSYIDCGARRKDVNNLLTVVSCVALIFSMVGGILYDKYGAKFSSLFGIFFSTLSWISLIIANVVKEVSGFFYYFSMFILGFSAQPLILAAFSVADMFPKNHTFFLGWMHAMVATSVGVPLLLSYIYNFDIFGPNQFWIICVGYIGTALLYAFINTMINLPVSPPCENRDVPVSISKEINDGTCVMIIEDAEDENNSKIELSEIFSGFLKEVKGPRFICSVSFLCTLALRHDFYMKSILDVLKVGHSDAYTLFSVTNLLLFIPGLILGKFAEKFGSMAAFFVVNLSGLLMYAFLVPELIICRYVSVILRWIYASYVYGSYYAFIRTHYPSKLFGMLSGFSFLVAGSVAFLTIPLYNLSVSRGNFLFANIFMMVMGAIGFVLLGKMCCVKEKRDNTAVETPAALELLSVNR